VLASWFQEVSIRQLRLAAGQAQVKGVSGTWKDAQQITTPGSSSFDR